MTQKNSLGCQLLQCEITEHSQFVRDSLVGAVVFLRRRCRFSRLGLQPVHKPLEPADERSIFGAFKTALRTLN